MHKKTKERQKEYPPELSEGLWIERFDASDVIGGGALMDATDPVDLAIIKEVFTNAPPQAVLMDK